MGQVRVECCGGEEKTRGRIDSDLLIEFFFYYLIEFHILLLWLKEWAKGLKVNISTNTKPYLHSYVSRVYYCNFHNILHPQSGWYDGWQTEVNVQVLQPF